MDSYFKYNDETPLPDTEDYTISKDYKWLSIHRNQNNNLSLMKITADISIKKADIEGLTNLIKISKTEYNDLTKK